MLPEIFTRGCDAQDVFQNLAIAGYEKYSQYRNRFSVIHISFNDIAEDLRAEYPGVKSYGEGNKPSYYIITTDISLSAEKEDGPNGRQNCALLKYIS